MNDSSIANMTHRAQTCLASGQIEEAKSLYSELCHVDSKNEEHWLTMAAIYGESGEIEEALKCANRAIELDDTYVEAYLSKAHLLQKAGNNSEAFNSALKAVEHDDTYDEAMVFLTGLAGHMKRFDDAERWALKTIALLPDNVDALLNLANAKYELTKYGEAESCYKKALKINSSNHQAIVGLAKATAAQGRYDEAMAQLKSFLTIAPANYQAKDILTFCLINLDRDDEAEEMLVELIKTTPNSVFSYIHIADIAERRGDHLLAINYLQQALENTDQPLEALGELARIYLEYGMHQQAIDSCKKAMEIDPGNKSANFYLALTLSNSAHYEEALKEIDSLVLDTPDNPLYLGARANLLERLGNYEEAHQIIKSLLNDNTINEDTVAENLADIYARLCYKFDECDEATAMIYQILKKQDLDKSCRRGLLFTLGKLQDRLHNYDSAFEAIHEANKLKPYICDHEKYTNYINRLIHPDITGLIRKPRIISSTRRVSPVFIFGMPRSGTSLVEQIISSHPNVIAGGERQEISSLVLKLPFMKGIEGSYPECLTEITPDMIEQMLAAFDSFTQGLASGITLITDKMPENYQHLVFIRMLFPDARIIHCIRNPMDTCLSCYFQQFTGYHDYAYNLEDLGKHYNEYKRLMNHYRDVDKVPFMEVQYEELVHNTEEVTRQMIEYCGLDWDERCLQYYDNDQIVRTASYDQVNKPIYTGSINKWKHYESYLKPLYDALDQAE